MIVPVVLGFYFLVCISVILFNCWKVLSEALIRRKLVRRKRNFLVWFWCNGARCASFSPEEQEKMARRLARKLRTVGRLAAFQRAMDEAEQESPAIFAESLPLLARAVREALPFYEGRADTRQAYYSYLVTRFHAMKYAPGEPLTAFLMEQIRQARSLYNLENALRAVYSSGQVPLVLEALRAVDGADGVFIHEKLLIDGLLTFEDRDALIAALWERFPQYGVEMRELLLDYIRFASGGWKEPMLELLGTTQELEIQIACLRYFGKYPDERVRPLLYDRSRDPDGPQWELCAVCMTVLASYPGGETVQLLKQGLRSRNWYVRYNAALSLRGLNVDAETVRDVLDGDDRYAREMLQYRLGLGAQAVPEEEAVPV